MEPVIVKFETPEPVKFKEPDLLFPGTDQECEARMAFESVVTEYDDKRYSCVDDVISKIREISLELVKTCLEEWPKGSPVIRSDGRDEIADHLDREFEKTGIVAQTKIKTFSLTEESEAWYRSMIGAHYISIIGPDKVGGPYVVNNEGQPVLGDHTPLPKGVDDRMRSSAQSFVDGVNPDTLAFKPGDFDEDSLYGKKPNGAGDKYCRQCGEKREKNAKFCSNCGAKFG